MRGNHFAQQAAVGKIEHGDIQSIARQCSGDACKQGIADLAFGQELHVGALVLRRDRACLGCSSGGLWPVRTRHQGDGPLATQQVKRSLPTEAQRGVAMCAAAIMRVGGGHQSSPGVAFVHYQGLAMVGIEVQQGQIAAQRDLARTEWIGQPASFLVVAGPATAQLPQARPGRVGRA